ncbi:MAG: hypothetical protein AAFW81_08830 [Pseudomonadota bacterium]
MIRNLIVIIIASIVGLAAAKFTESIVGGNAGDAAGARYIAGLVVGYFLGAFIAAAIALIGGRRWAPLGWLGAATIFFGAVITMVTYALPFIMWPASAAACALGGWIAIRLLKAEAAPPATGGEGLFD